MATDFDFCKVLDVLGKNDRSSGAAGETNDVI